MMEVHVVDFVSSTYSGVSAYQRTTSFDRAFVMGAETPAAAPTSTSASTFTPDPASAASAKQTDAFGPATVTAKADAEKTLSAYANAFGGKDATKGRFVRDEVKLSQQAKDALTAQERFQESRAISLDVASASLNSVQIVAQDLTGASFAGTDLSKGNLSYSNFSGADFSGASLRGTNFLNADVTGASFSGADLRGADLSGVTGLSRDQLNKSRFDSSTKLPFSMTA